MILKKRRLGEPTDASLLRAAVRAGIAQIRTAAPGEVVSYDASTQTCECKLTVQIPNASGEPETVAPLTDVPVALARGGGYFVSVPLAPGDPVLLVFCEVDFSAWRDTGEVSAPGTQRRHGLYAYAIPGGCVVGDELADASADHLVLGKDGGPTVHVDADGIRLGADVVAKAARADLVQARLDALADVFNNWVPAPQDGGAALKSALSSWLSGSNDVACSKVEVE